MDSALDGEIGGMPPGQQPSPELDHLASAAVVAVAVEVAAALAEADASTCSDTLITPSAGAQQPGGPLQVDKEDCTSFSGFHAVVLSSPSVSPEHRAVPAAAYYVESPRRNGGFVHVAPRRARQRYGIGHPSQSPARRSPSPSAGIGEQQRRQWALTVSAVQALAVHEDATELISGDAVDLEVFALLAASEQSKLLWAIVACASQGLLVGLSLVASMLTSLEEGSVFASTLCALEPGFTGLSAACAEICLVWRALCALGSSEAVQRTWRDATFDLLLALANAAVLLSSALLSASGAENCWQRAVQGSASRPGSVDEDAGRSLLRVHAGCGLVALGLAMLEMWRLVSPRLPPEAVTQLLAAQSCRGEFAVAAFREGKPKLARR